MYNCWVSTDEHLVVAEKAWQQLADGHDVPAYPLREEIALSWKRCLEKKMCPITSKNTGVAAHFDDYLSQHDALCTIAKPHMRSLYDSLNSSGFIIILTTADGLILDVFGDEKMRSRAEQLTVVPGASCLEEVLATTSPGICIACRGAVQVFHSEHYCQLYHEWCCSAAPIVDSRNNLLGTLDISNTVKNRHHPLILDLVKITAQCIGREYSHRAQEGVTQKYFHYLKGVMNQSREGLILLDEHDQPTHINTKAQAILGSDVQQYIGRNISTITQYCTERNLSHKSGKNTTLQLITDKGLLAVDAEFRKIQRESADRSGTLCTLRKKNENNQKQHTRLYTFADLIYNSSVMEQVVISAQRVATTDLSVCMGGESGTGKEVFAQAIHSYSQRADGPFVVVNCAGLPHELIQSELFGYEPGSFTGAHKRGKAGKFELADKGTIFLDEIGDMPLEAQANLLRVLQEKSVVRIGGALPRQLDIRIICATNKDLALEIEQGRFRQDLFYRLNTVPFYIPPLRDRIDDLWVLFEHFFAQQGDGNSSLTFSPRSKRLLQQYKWPGNVRELENTALFLAHKIGNGVVNTQDLPDLFHGNQSKQRSQLSLSDTEAEAIEQTLCSCNGNISRTAKRLGISRATLYRKMEKYKIASFKN